MSLIEKIQQSLIKSLKAKQEARVLTLRGVSSAIQNKEIEFKGLGKELQEQDILDVLKKELKKRNDSMQLFIEGGRTDLADKEKAEADIIQEFLPRMLSEQETAVLVDEVFAGYENPTMKDMGTLIKAVVEKSGGAADSSLVAKLVKGKLS